MKIVLKSDFEIIKENHENIFFDLKTYTWVYVEMVIVHESGGEVVILRQLLWEKCSSENIRVFVVILIWVVICLQPNMNNVSVALSDLGPIIMCDNNEGPK